MKPVIIDPSALHEFTEVRQSLTPGAGLGLFATRRIPMGTVWWKAGPDNCINVTRRQYETLLRSELAGSPESRQLLEALQRYGYINETTGELVVAVDNSRFVNHSDTPSSMNAPEAPDDWSMAARDIEPGEEITEDYRTYSEDTWGMPDEDFLRPLAADDPA